MRSYRIALPPPVAVTEAGGTDGLTPVVTDAALPGDLTLMLEDDRGSTFSPLPL